MFCFILLPQELKAFERYPETVVVDLCRYAEYEKLPSKITCMYNYKYL